MALCKKIKSLSLNLKIKKEGGTLVIVFLDHQKLLLKLRIRDSFTIRNTGILLLNSRLTEFDYSNFLGSTVNRLSSAVYGHYSQFSKLYMIGLGFKNFVLGQKLYILVGDCNYLVFDIPWGLKIFCKKNQIYLLGINETEIFNFMSNIKRIKKSNFYKGKGVLEFKNFKFTKLKVGKKQRFM